MQDRKVRLRLTVASCATIAVCWLAFGHEAKSTPRPLFVANSEGKKPFRYHRPFRLRITSQGQDFSGIKTADVSNVKYTDDNGTFRNWTILGVRPDPTDKTSFVLLLEPLKPGSIEKEGQRLDATGSGSIIVTTMNPPTTTGSGIPVLIVTGSEDP